MGSAKLSNQLMVALVALAWGCAATGAAQKSSLRPEKDAALGSLPPEVSSRLARIWRFQEQARCPQPAAIEPAPPGYTMEPSPTSHGPSAATACYARIDASETVAIDLVRLYGGCDACIASCRRRDSDTARSCWQRCDLAALGDYRRHVQQLSSLLASYDQGFGDWSRALEPRAGAPESEGDLTRCAEPTHQ